MCEVRLVNRLAPWLVRDYVGMQLSSVGKRKVSVTDRFVSAFVAQDAKRSSGRSAERGATSVLFPVVGRKRRDPSDDVLATVTAVPASESKLNMNVPMKPGFIWSACEAAVPGGCFQISVTDPMHSKVDGNSLQAAVACAVSGYSLIYPITGGVSRVGNRVQLTPIGEVPEKLSSLIGPLQKLILPAANAPDVPPAEMHKCVFIQFLDELVGSKYMR